MKKTICLLLILLLALVPILVSAANNDDVETITLIKYDCDTGIQSEIVIEVDENGSIAPSPLLNANPNNTRILIPSDDEDGCYRERVYLGAYNTYPYSAIGSLVTVFLGGEARSTSFIVEDRIALTSAHCVYDSAFGFALQGYFLPHSDATASNQFVIDNGAIVDSIYINSSYLTDDSMCNDWAILVFEEDIGTENGTITLSIGAAPYSQEILLIGYDISNIMYLSHGHPISYSINEVVYNCDTTAGNSGSPVFYKVGSSYYCFAIHSRWITSTSNGGCRITQNLVDTINTLNEQS